MQCCNHLEPTGFRATHEARRRWQYRCTADCTVSRGGKSHTRAPRRAHALHHRSILPRYPVPGPTDSIAHCELISVVCGRWVDDKGWWVPCRQRLLRHLHKPVSELLHNRRLIVILVPRFLPILGPGTGRWVRGTAASNVSVQCTHDPPAVRAVETPAGCTTIRFDPTCMSEKVQKVHWVPEDPEGAGREHACGRFFSPSPR